MEAGDLVRINLPERARELPSYYYHNCVGIVLSTTKHESQGPELFTAVVLVDGVERGFANKYLEVI